MDQLGSHVSLNTLLHIAEIYGGGCAREITQDAPGFSRVLGVIGAGCRWSPVHGIPSIEPCVELWWTNYFNDRA